MKTTNSASIFFLAVALVIAGLAGPRLSAAEPVLGKAADNKILAQQLVNQQVAKPANKDLAILGLHAVPPEGGEQRMIACNLDRIGKADSEDDKVVFREQKTFVFAKLSQPGVFEVMTPIKDAANNVIGMAVFVFHDFKPGGDETSYYLRAVQMRDEMARATPSHAALFSPAP